MNAANTSDSLSTSHSLIFRLKARDEKAWERMVHLYSPLISFWCSRSSLNPDEAADVTQDVLRTVSQSIDVRFHEVRVAADNIWFGDSIPDNPFGAGHPIRILSVCLAVLLASAGIFLLYRYYSRS